jgi:DNA-directed RNA polymerase specialized sigma24 family protein
MIEPFIPEAIPQTMSEPTDQGPGETGATDQDPESSIAYLRQILKNRVLDAVRRAARCPAGPPLDHEYATPDRSPLEIAIGREALERYETALSKLSPLDQQLVFARVELDFSAAEIAAAFDKPSAAAAQMAVSRALMRLAEVMAHA